MGFRFDESLKGAGRGGGDGDGGITKGAGAHGVGGADTFDGFPSSSDECASPPAPTFIRMS